MSGYVSMAVMSAIRAYVFAHFLHSQANVNIYNIHARWCMSVSASASAMIVSYNYILV